MNTTPASAQSSDKSRAPITQQRFELAIETCAIGCGFLTSRVVVRDNQDAKTILALESEYVTEIRDQKLAGIAFWEEYKTGEPIPFSKRAKAIVEALNAHHSAHTPEAPESQAQGPSDLNSWEIVKHGKSRKLYKNKSGISIWVCNLEGIGDDKDGYEIVAALNAGEAAIASAMKGGDK